MLTNGQRIRFPLHFVCPDHLIWAELAGLPRGGRISEERLSELSKRPVECWILRSYHELRAFGDEVSVGPHTRRGAVNIAHVFDFGRKMRLNLDFLVLTQGDGYRSALANFNIRQNGLEANSSAQDWVPHWLQPGIKPRKTERGNTLRSVAYRGHPANLVDDISGADFASTLAKRGVTFDSGIGPEGVDSAWNDYTEVDALVAVRNATVEDLHNKPASKLVNAWAAGVPAILGPEPAYQELRRSQLDFIEVSNAREAIAAIDWLKANPDKYQSMVRNGLERVRDFSTEKLALRWVKMLDGPIARAFSAWRQSGSARRIATVARMLLEEPQRKRKYVEERDHGTRLFAQ